MLGLFENNNDFKTDLASFLLSQWRCKESSLYENNWLTDKIYIFSRGKGKPTGWNGRSAGREEKRRQRRRRWLIDWLIVWLIDWLIDWSIDWLIVDWIRIFLLLTIINCEYMQFNAKWLMCPSMLILLPKLAVTHNYVYPNVQNNMMLCIQANTTQLSNDVVIMLTMTSHTMTSHTSNLHCYSYSQKWYSMRSGIDSESISIVRVFISHDTDEIDHFLRRRWNCYPSLLRRNSHNFRLLDMLGVYDPLWSGVLVSYDPVWSAVIQCIQISTSQILMKLGTEITVGCDKHPREHIARN